MDKRVQRHPPRFPRDALYADRFEPAPLKPFLDYDDGTVAIWVPLSGAFEGWRASMYFAVREAVIELVDVRLHPLDAASIEGVPVGGITRRMLCAIPLGE